MNFDPSFLTDLLTLVGLVLFIVLFWRLLPDKAQPVDAKVLPTYKEKPLGRYQLLSAVSDDEFKRQSPTFSDQTESWQQSMMTLGRALCRHDVGLFMCVHGTFVGHDPIGITQILQRLEKRRYEYVVKRLARLSRQYAKFFVDDLGNFTDEYVQLLQQAVGQEVLCKNFVWSGANHHAARFLASIEMAHYIDYVLTQKKRQLNRVLLWGHSHAGQVFALLMQLLWGDPLIKEALIKVAVLAGQDRDRLLEVLERLAHISFDVVTFGSPRVYPWPLTPKYRVLHFVNHRGREPFTDGMKGILTTQGGDYVCQIALQGSDIVPVSKSERMINAQLEAILGLGHNIAVLKKEMARGHRTHPVGLTLLTDYHDESSWPNFYRTIFGHGVYTQYQFLRFHLDVVVKSFYKDSFSFIKNKYYHLG